MMEWSVVSQLKEVLSQGVPGIVQAKGAVHGRDDAILSARLSSEELWFALVVFNSFKDHTLWENVFVAFDSHDESSELQIHLRRAYDPHFVEDLVSLFDEGNGLLQTLVDQFSVLIWDSLVYFVECLNLLVSL